MKLKQIGVRAGTLKSNSTLYFVNFINKNPIALNMTFKRIFPFALKRMITAFRRQRLFVDDHFHNFTKFINIQCQLVGDAFSHQLELLSKTLWVNRLKHGLIVHVVRLVPIKVFPHRLKGMKTAQCGRYLAPHHGPAFLNSRDSFGVGHIVVRGANGAYAVRVKPVIVSISRLSVIRPLVNSRSKGKNHLPRRNFTGNINNQPMISRNVYSLCHSHGRNIA